MPIKISAFMAELKRRKVYHVAAVYVVVGLGILGAAELVLDPLGLEAARPLIVILTLLGFPLALVLAWAYEVKPEEPRVGEMPEGGTALHAGSTQPVDVTESEQRKSIVVLPFANMSPDPNDAYFSDGLTEEIITHLSYLRSLRVISRSSAVALKDSQKDVRSIGRELDVQYVLEGSVRKAGDELRITAQLIDAKTDAHLWAEKYDGALTDVFEMQERVSRAIVEALELKLSPREAQRIAERPIPNLAAYDYYLRARAGIGLFTAAGLDQAVGFLEKGLEIVGDNVLLYRGMGYAHFQYVNAQIDPSDHHLDEAEAYASKIAEIDPTSPDVSFLRGLVAMQRGQLREGVRQLARAYDADPHDPDVALWLAVGAMFAGLNGRARQVARALEVTDPFTPNSLVVTPYLDFLEGRFEEAAASLERVYSMDQGNLIVAVCYAHVLGAVGDLEAMSQVVGESVRRVPDAAMTQAIAVLVHALRGDAGAVHDAVTDELVNMIQGDWQWCHLLADCYGSIGDRTKALQWLEKAIDLGYLNYPFLNDIDPFLASIRDEQRFRDLMTRVREEWRAFTKEME